MAWKTVEDWEREQAALPIISEAIATELIIALGAMQPDPNEWVKRFMGRVQDRIDYAQLAAQERDRDQPAVYDAARVAIERWTGYCAVRAKTDE